MVFAKLNGELITKIFIAEQDKAIDNESRKINLIKLAEKKRKIKHHQYGNHWKKD